MASLKTAVDSKKGTLHVRVTDYPDAAHMVERGPLVSIIKLSTAAAVLVGSSGLRKPNEELVSVCCKSALNRTLLGKGCGMAEIDAEIS